MKPPDPLANAVPWRPAGLPAAKGELETAWAYLVVEEIVDHLALLRRWPWPVVDERGRLQWSGSAEQDSRAVAVPVDLLRSQVYVPNKIERQPRCGDTFAAAGLMEAGWKRRDTEVRDVRTLFAGKVYDISADSRDAAKIAYAAGLAPVQPLTPEDTATRAVIAAEPPVAARALSIGPPPATTTSPRPSRRAAR